MIIFLFKLWDNVLEPRFCSDPRITFGFSTTSEKVVNDFFSEKQNYRNKNHYAYVNHHIMARTTSGRGPLFLSTTEFGSYLSLFSSTITFVFSLESEFNAPKSTES